MIASVGDLDHFISGDQQRTSKPSLLVGYSVGGGDGEGRIDAPQIKPPVGASGYGGTSHTRVINLNNLVAKCPR